MADSYTVQGTKSDIQITGPSTVVDVVVVSATAQPSGVNFEYPVPAATYATDGVDSSLQAPAWGVNYLAASPNVSSVFYTQQVDASGLLGGYMEVTVTIPTPPGLTGPFTLVVPIPMTAVAVAGARKNGSLQPYIDKAVAQLEATAGVTTAAPATTAAASG